MARLKSDLRNCKMCSHKKTDIKNLCYYCSNKQSEHYMEQIKDDTLMIKCKGGNTKKLYKDVIMGDGKKLKEILDSKNTNVRQIAKATGISATTLYSIIQKDSDIRLDFALRLANELEIDANEICSKRYLFDEYRMSAIENLLDSFCQTDAENGTIIGKLNEAKKDLCDWIMNLTVREFFDLSSFLEAGYDIPGRIVYSCSECKKEYNPSCEAPNEKQCFQYWCRHYNIEMSDEK